MLYEVITRALSLNSFLGGKAADWPGTLSKYTQTGARTSRGASPLVGIGTQTAKARKSAALALIGLSTKLLPEVGWWNLLQRPRNNFV